MNKVKFNMPGGGMIEIEGENVSKMMRQVMFWQSLPHECPCCGEGTRIYTALRGGNSYMGLECRNGHVNDFHLHNDDTGDLYYTPDWYRYDYEAKQRVDLIVKGRKVAEAKPTQPAQAGPTVHANAKGPTMSQGDMNAVRINELLEVVYADVAMRTSQRLKICQQDGVSSLPMVTQETANKAITYLERRAEAQK